MSLADPYTTAMSAVVVARPLTAADAEFAAALHEKALPHGFFGRLGVRFLTAYYRSFADSPHGIALIAQTPDGNVGALVGTVCNGSHYGWVLRNQGVLLARRGLLALATRPSELTFFLRTRVGRYLKGLLRLLRRSASPSATAAQSRAARRGRGAPAVLTHVAVAPEARGLGVGAVLVDAFVAAARRAGCREACLVTLADDRGAGAFYQRLGWELQGVREDRDGQALEAYCRQL